MRIFLAALALALTVTGCHSSTSPLDCARDPKVPSDTATTLYNGERIYLNSCATLEDR